MIINAKIYTMDENETVIENGFIRTDGKIITEIGEMSSLTGISADAFDAAGRSVYPGFIDAHTHLGLFDDSLSFEGDDGNESTEPVMPQLRVIDAVDPFDGYFPEALSAGITTVLVSPGSADPIGGQIAAIKTQGKRIDNMIVKAPVGIKLALGENPKSVFSDKDQSPSTRMATASVIRDALRKAHRYYIDKKNHILDRDNCDEPEYDSRCEALVPLFKKEIPAHFHVHRADDIFTAVRIAMEFDLEYVLVHATEAYLIIDELKNEKLRGILSGPILTDRSKPELKNLTPKAVGIIAKNLPTAVITDHPETPIQYLCMCCAVAVREGMDRNDAIRAITSVPAKICGIYDRVGSIKKGKDCDLVIYDGDPLNIMNKPSAVFINGKKVR